MTRRTVLLPMFLLIAMTMTTVSMAGPPLICPQTVLTEAEQASLAKLNEKDASAKQKAADFIALLDASDSSRFHLESIRFYFLGHVQNGFDALVDALDRRADRQKRDSLARFDDALAHVLAGYSSQNALRWIDEIALIADSRKDPALLLTVSEAIDLAGLRTGGCRHLESQLSLMYFERALDAAAASGSSDSAALNRKLLATHVSYIRRMHAKDWDWKTLDTRVKELG